MAVGASDTTKGTTTMCVIAVAETRRISRDELMLQWEANPHGGGLAYIKDGQVHYEKGFESPDELWKAVKKLPLPYVVHTRIATAGGIRRDLTHPFPITERVKLALRGACKAVLFHNGHWNGYEMAQATMDQSIGALNGAVSDSRVMARVLAVQGIDARELVPTSQRLCLLSAADGVTHHEVELGAVEGGFAQFGGGGEAFFGGGFDDGAFG